MIRRPSLRTAMAAVGRGRTAGRVESIARAALLALLLVSLLVVAATAIGATAAPGRAGLL